MSSCACGEVDWRFSTTSDSWSAARPIVTHAKVRLLFMMMMMSETFTMSIGLIVEDRSHAFEE
jgi:hypothetical protein